MRSVLIIAASDSSGGAGIHQDQRAVESLGLWPLFALTALSVQGPEGLCSLRPLPDDFLAEQMEAALSAYDVAAVKLGALVSAAQARVVASVLSRRAPVPLVVDPVFSPSRGSAFLPAAEIGHYLDALAPPAALFCPNHGELRAMAEAWGVEGPAATPAHQALLLARSLGRGVVLTGGHGGDPRRVVEHYAAPDGRLREFVKARLELSHGHGTGCAFSAFLAALLALGKAPEEAVPRASALVGRLHRRRGAPSLRLSGS